MSKVCNICQEPLISPIYSTPSSVSITSLCELIPYSSQVYSCQNCEHTLTSPLENIEEYYSENYKILVDSEEEDQIVSFPDGHKVFRFELQVRTILEKIDIPKNARVLDYGCAKSTTLKNICEQRQDISPYLFDVSENYIPFWKRFVKPSNWAINKPKADWKKAFDIVTSFFSLEHVSEPVEMVKNIYGLLKDDGIFYFIVPNMFANIADFVVVDHVNHFSVSSIHTLLNLAGFVVIEIDEDVHYGAFVIVAQKNTGTSMNNQKQKLTDKMGKSVTNISEYWQNISNSITEYESKHDDVDNISAIYGSGFYGTFIASCLRNIDRVKIFIDQNPYRQGMHLLNKEIISPDQVTDDVKVIYVGLNPSIARRSIESVTCLMERNIQFYYL